MKNSKAKNQTKQSSDNTRERIVKAAREVFSELPYHMATVRMVGKAGGFDHQLISYYFPTKSDLFEAVISDACDEFYNASLTFFEGLGGMNIEDGFKLFVERLLEYAFKNPETPRMMALNAPLTGRLDDVPGYQQIPEFMSKTRATFINNLPPRVDREELGRFVTTFDNAWVSYLGAAPSQARLLGMDHESEEYRAWVKETLISVFLPPLKKLLFPG